MGRTCQSQSAPSGDGKLGKRGSKSGALAVEIIHCCFSIFRFLDKVALYKGMDEINSPFLFCFFFCSTLVLLFVFTVVTSFSSSILHAV